MVSGNVTFRILGFLALLLVACTDTVPGVYEPVEEQEPLTIPEGWAGLSGPVAPAAIGGFDGKDVWPQTSAELSEYASSQEPLVIHIQDEHFLAALQVTSNKTLLGKPKSGATLHGSILLAGSADTPIDNVVIRNLKVDAGAAAGDYGIDLKYARNVWIDHCEVLDAKGGLLEISPGSDLISISWNKFHFTPLTPDAQHRFGARIGSGEASASKPEAPIRVTMHHNFWGDWIDQRMPRVRFGDVHLYNNFYDLQLRNDYAVWATVGTHLLAEHNYFDQVHWPLRMAGLTTPYPPELLDVDNYFVDTTGLTQVTDQPTVQLVPEYEYSLDPVLEVREKVYAGAGTR